MPALGIDGVVSRLRPEGRLLVACRQTRTCTDRNLLRLGAFV